MAANHQSEDAKSLRAALELVWRVHVKENTHLGLERHSGITQRCIPCICAAALGRLIDYDGVPADTIESVLDAVRNEPHG